MLTHRNFDNYRASWWYFKSDKSDTARVIRARLGVIMRTLCSKIAAVGRLRAWLNCTANWQHTSLSRLPVPVRHTLIATTAMFKRAFEPTRHERLLKSIVNVNSRSKRLAQPCHGALSLPNLFTMHDIGHSLCRVCARKLHAVHARVVHAAARSLNSLLAGS